VEGSNGYFSGRGVVTIPWMSYIKLEVAFADIYVNELYQLAEGQIQAVYRMGNALVTSLPGVNRRNRIRNPYPQACDRSISMDSTVASVTLSLDGQIVITTTGGEQKVVDPGQAKTLAITSPEGKQYLVERTGKGTVIYEAPPIVNQDRTKPTQEERIRNRGKVFFSAHPEQKFGIDLPAEGDPVENYKKRTLGGEETLIGWKAVAQGQTDKITAVEQGITDSLYFAMASGNVVMSRREEENRREVVLADNPQEEEDGLYAWVTEKNTGDSVKRRRTLAGELMVVSYPAKYHQVILVPVNGARSIDPQKAEAYLNGIYSQAVVQFRVLTVDSFFVALKDKSGRLDNTDRNSRMDYSEEMKQVIRQWKKNVLYDPHAHYLFVLNGSVDPAEGGYMPLGRRYGFLFRNQQSEEELLHTLAHELGHGLFTLRHTFSTLNRFYQPQTSTDNLMSYGPPTATRLYKYQWDAIQNPSLALFSWMEREEEGELGLPCKGWFDDCDNVVGILDTIRSARIQGKKVRVRGKINEKPITLTAKYVRIGETDYKQIRLISNKKKSEYIYNPLDYEAYSQQYFNADGTIDMQNGFVYREDGKEVFKILVDDAISKIEKLKEYLFGKEYDEIKEVIISNSVLTPERIKVLREQIEMLKDENQKKELYLELQAKVPYHNQRNNNQSQYIADRMCNLTSEAMCLEYLGISCPFPKIQFEDYLEQIREDKNYGDRILPITRQNLAESLGACYQFVEFKGNFFENKEKIKDFILLKLQSGCAIMLSVWQICKGHLVRLQNITDEGLIVDDPYGKVIDFMLRENCNNGGYDVNSKKEENSKGNDNLWRWSDIKDVTIKYVEVYCKCK